MSNPHEQEIQMLLANMMQVMGVMIDRSKQIPLAEIVGTSFNGNPGLAHDKCGCPGMCGMIPVPSSTVTGKVDWSCGNCGGCVLAENAEPKLQEGRAGYEQMVEEFREANKPIADTPANRRQETIGPVICLFQEGRIDAQVPNIVPMRVPDFDPIAFLLQEGSIHQVTASGRSRRCRKKTCRHQGHFTYLTKKGAKRYLKEIWAAYSGSSSPRRDPALTKAAFTKQLMAWVEQYESLPEAK